MALPAPVEPLLAVGVVALCSFATLRLFARQAAKAPPKTAMGRIRTALGVGLPLTGLAALLAAVAADALDLTESALRGLSPALADSAAGAVLTWVPTLAGVVVAVVAGYLGAFPYVRDIRDAELSAATAATQFARWVAVFLSLVVAAVGAITRLPSVFTGTLPLLGVLAVAVGVTVAAQPVLFSLFRTTRPPTDAERDRLDRLSDRVDLSPRDVRVFETEGDPTATASLAGLPGRRRLFVTDYLLAEFDDDAVSAVLASETGRAKRYYREYKLAVVLLLAGLALGATTGDVAVLSALGAFEFVALFVGALLVLSRFGGRLVVAADDYAVERVGAETYAATLEAIADDHQLPYESGRLRSLLLMRPSLGRRLDRLWGRIGEESGRPDERSSDDSAE